MSNASISANSTALPLALSSLSIALAALPSNLSAVPLPLLTSLLTSLAMNLSSVTTDLAGTTAGDGLRDLLMGTEAGNATLTSDSVGTMRYTPLTAWAPDVISIVVLLGLAVLQKALLRFMLGKKHVEKVRQTGMRSEQAAMTSESAEAILERPARMAIAHGFNLVLTSVALALQCLAWPLFVLSPSSPLHFAEVWYISSALKLVALAYVSELLFAPVQLEIFFHHILTVGIFVVGQLAVFETRNTEIYRMLQWLLLQDTLEQAGYAGLMLFHVATWVHLQDYDAKGEKRLFVLSWFSLITNAVIGLPQKLIPVGFALYWLGTMWGDLDQPGWGRLWLAWSTTCIALLLLLQLYMCDEAFPLAMHTKKKAHGGPPPHPKGPIARIWAHQYDHSGLNAANPTPSSGVPQGPGFHGPMDLTHEAGEEEDVQIYERSYTYDMEHVGLLEKGEAGSAGGVPPRSVSSSRPRATPSRKAERYSGPCPPDLMGDEEKPPRMSEDEVLREEAEERQLTAQLKLEKARRERMEAEAELRAYDQGRM